MSYIKTGFKKVISPLVIAALALSMVAVPKAYASSYLTLSSFSGHPGQTITVSGGGLGPNDLMRFYVGSVSGTPVASSTTAIDGSYSSLLTIPANAPQGPLNIIGVDASNIQSSNSYYVIPLSISITETATSHSPFGSVLVSGTGFAPNEKVTVGLAGTSTVTQANASGAFANASVTIPVVPTGLYVIKATGQSSGATSVDYLNYFWIDAFYASISPTSYYVLPGQALSFNGSGFAPGETIAVTTTGSTTPLTTFTANASGSFTAGGSFAVPYSYGGTSRTFTLTGALSHASASANVTVGSFNPYGSPTSYFVLPTQQIGFNGGGFGANESISVSLVGTTTPLATFTANTMGTFLDQGLINIPANAAGTSAIFTLTGAASHVSTNITVGVGSFYPTITPSAYYATGNTSITVAGSGFAPNESVTLQAGNGSTTQATANALGVISAPVFVPFSALGSATITAIGATSNAKASVGITLAKFYPTITPSTYYAFPGSSISFKGSGFVPNESVTVLAGGATTTIMANAAGTFTTATTTVPFTKVSSISYTFSGAMSGNPVSSVIGIGTLSPYLNSDSYSANPGQVIHMTGYTFAPGETVTITAGSFSTTTVANAAGNTSAVAITVPYSSGSSLKVVFTGNSSGVSSSLSLALGAFYPSVVASNYYAVPGSTITLTASGFAPNETLHVMTGISASSTATAMTNALGEASIPVVLSYGATGKLVYTVSGMTSGVSAGTTISLAPLSAQVNPSTYYAAPGSTITFVGTSFAPNESVTVSLNGATQSVVTASSTGTFSYSSVIPLNAKVAAYVFTGNASGAHLPLTITLSQFYSSITLSTYYAQGGSALSIIGTGFGPNESVSFSQGGSVFGSSTANASGAFTYSGSVPFAPAGKATITATGNGSGTVATSPITIAPVYTSFNFGQYAGAPGMAISMTGSGYLPNEPVEITTDRSGSTPVVFTTNAAGNFSGSYLVPTSFAAGNLAVTATSKHSFDTKTITYYVTGISSVTSTSTN